METPNISSAPRSLQLFFILLFCCCAHFPLTREGKIWDEFKKSWSQFTILKNPIKIIEKTMGDFLAHPAGCLHSSSRKDDVDPTLCRSRGRWDKDLEEEYTKDYMETASGSRYFEIRSRVQKSTKTNPHKCLSYS